MDVIKYTRPRTISDLLAYEVDEGTPGFCRETGVLLAGSGSARTITQFAVLGVIALGAQSVASAAKAGNTGNGTLGTLTADAAVPAGVYRAVFIEPASNLGTFVVFAPDGTVDGEGVVGTAYNCSVNFTIADGATDFISGDEFDITVTYAAGSGKYVQLDLAATTGQQHAAGVSLFGGTAADGVDGTIDYLARGPAIVRLEELIWPAGISGGQKTAALAELAALGILARASG